MRSNKYSQSEFFHKMKKKPALQKVLDNLDDYSKEDIDNLSGGPFPKWVREELKKMKTVDEEYTARGNKTAEEVAMEIAQQMIEASNKRNKN